MKNNLQDNKVTQKLKQHPTAIKIGGGGIGGVIITVILNKLTGFINEISFSQAIEWVSKLKAFIGNHSFAMIICVIATILLIYRLQELNKRKELEKKFIEATMQMIEQDNTIADINIKGKGNEISIFVNRDINANKHIRTQKQDKLVHFPNNKKHGG